MTASFEDIFTRLIAEAETAAASQAATAPPAVAVEAESATGNIRMRMEAGRLTGKTKSFPAKACDVVIFWKIIT